MRLGVVRLFEYLEGVFAAMGMLGTLMRHPDEIAPLVKLKIAAMQAQRAIPKDPNLAFCYRMLTRVSRSFSIVIQQLRPELRDAVSSEPLFFVIPHVL